MLKAKKDNAAVKSSFEESLSQLFKVYEKECRRDMFKEKRQRRALEELRNWLSDKRDKRRQGYMNNAAHLQSYLFYYFPLHLPEVFWIYEQLFLTKKLKLGQNWMDIGSGPGTATLSRLLFLKFKKLPMPEEILLADHSKKALCFASKAVKAISPETRVIEVKIDLRDKRALLRFVQRNEDHWDSMLMSHVLNELGNGPKQRGDKWTLLESLSRCLKKKHTITLVEPPLRSPTIDLMALRDTFQLGGAHVAAPCPSSTQGCPLLEKRGGWCYSQPPREMAKEHGFGRYDKDIEKTLKIKLTQSSFSYLVLQNTHEAFEFHRQHDEWEFEDEEGSSAELESTRSNDRQSSNTLSATDSKAKPKHKLSVANSKAPTGLICDGSKIVKRPRKNHFRGQWIRS